MSALKQGSLKLIDKRQAVPLRRPPSTLCLLNPALGNSDQKAQCLIDRLGIGKSPGHIFGKTHVPRRSLPAGSARHHA